MTWRDKIAKVSYPGRLPEMADLPFWQLWTQFGLSPRRVVKRSLRAKCMGLSIGLPVNRVWNGGSDLQAGVEIYYLGHL